MAGIDTIFILKKASTYGKIECIFNSKKNDLFFIHFENRSSAENFHKDFFSFFPENSKGETVDMQWADIYLDKRRIPFIFSLSRNFPKENNNNNRNNYYRFDDMKRSLIHFLFYCFDNVLKKGEDYYNHCVDVNYSSDENAIRRYGVIVFKYEINDGDVEKVYYIYIYIYI